MARSPLFHGDIPGTWGTAECLIFMPAVLRAPGSTLSLTTQSVEAVYSPGTYFTLGDNKSRWTTLLERAELDRVERNRYVRNVVKQGIALRTRIIALPTCRRGTYKVQHVMAVRRKYRPVVPSGRSLIPDDIFMEPRHWLLRQKSRESIRAHKSTVR